MFFPMVQHLQPFAGSCRFFQSQLQSQANEPTCSGRGSRAHLILVLTEAVGQVFFAAGDDGVQAKISLISALEQAATHRMKPYLSVTWYNSNFGSSHSSICPKIWTEKRSGSSQSVGTKPLFCSIYLFSSFGVALDNEPAILIFADGLSGHA